MFVVVDGVVLEEDFVEGVGKGLEGLLPLVGTEFAFPDGDGVPSHGGKFVLHFLVAGFVAGHLVLPEGGVGLGHLVVRTALVSVPEAAIDEDASAVASEHDVGFAWQARVVEPIAEAMRPQIAAHQQLGFGVLAVDCRHVCMPLWGNGRLFVHFFVEYLRVLPEVVAGEEVVVVVPPGL